MPENTLVYAVLWSKEYEGDSLKGIFTERSKAEKVAREQARSMYFGMMTVQRWSMDNPDDPENGKEITSYC